MYVIGSEVGHAKLVGVGITNDEVDEVFVDDFEVDVVEVLEEDFDVDFDEDVLVDLEVEEDFEDDLEEDVVIELLEEVFDVDFEVELVVAGQLWTVLVTVVELMNVIVTNTVFIEVPEYTVAVEVTKGCGDTMTVETDVVPLVTERVEAGPAVVLVVITVAVEEM